MVYGKAKQFVIFAFKNLNPDVYIKEIEDLSLMICVH